MPRKIVSPGTTQEKAHISSGVSRQVDLLKTGALQKAILNSANFSSIATDEKGVIQIFNVGAERMLGYAAADVVNRITPAEISDPRELIARASALSEELATTIQPGFEALVFKASRGIEDIYELTYICKDGSRLPALVSVTALHDNAAAIIGYLLTGTDNTARKQIEAEKLNLAHIQEETNKRLLQAYTTLQASEDKLVITLNSIGDAVLTTDADACVVLLNPVAEEMTGWTQAQAAGKSVNEIFRIINKETRQPAFIPVHATLEQGITHGLANHTVLIALDGTQRDIADSCAPIRDRDGKVIGAVLVFRDVTNAYAAHQALNDSNAMIQTILNTVADGIITLHADSCNITTLNPTAERMFGYRAEEIIGRNFSVLIPELEPGQHLARHSIEYYSASEEARAQGLGREVCGFRKNGSRFPIEMAISEMRLGGQRYFTGILRDITARTQAAEELLKAGALQRAIFNSANFSCIATDAKGVIQIFNVGAERMLGYAAADVMNRLRPSDISDQQEIVARASALSQELDTIIKPGFEAMVFKASRGIEDIYELTYIRKDGSHCPALVSVTALRDTHNSIIGYLLIGTDNAARKQIESDRKQSETELQMAMDAAKKANLAKSDFLSSMSHELRTPLSAILGFAQLMESGSPPPTSLQQRSIGQILKAGWYLLDLINEILDLALVESGKLSLSLEPIAVNEVMHECQAMVEPEARKHGITINFPRLATRHYVNADRTRMKQVLINLLGNAIKYNISGGTVEVQCITVGDERIRICVKDSGEGLTPAQLTQLFQPFNRLGQELKKTEGTGIGLVMTKRLTELMGGSVGVESSEGKGSVFWIELPLTTSPQVVVTALASILQKPMATNLPIRTLLYVEDNPANLMLVEDLIARRPDIRLLSALDGNHGLELARSEQPDVILMDINLPGISGLQVLALLAEDPATVSIPVIALSANAMPRDIERGLEAGFLEYITKPIRVNEFLTKLDHAFAVAAAGPDRNDTLVSDTVL